MKTVEEFYADTAKPSWAGGTYNPEQLTEGRNLDTKIISKRSGSRDLEISLPSELVGENAPDRAMPILINGDTDPMKQVGAVFADGAELGTVRFSRSEKGK